MCNSILALEAIFDEKWTKMRKELNFVLVYNEKQNPDNDKEYYHNQVYNRAAGSKGVKFNLSDYYGVYFRDIKTLTEKEFTEFVKSEGYHL